MSFFLLHKPVGLSPLQAIQLAREQYPQYATARLGAAGRLDPMAEGLLLIMVDEDNKRQGHYLGLDKTYEVEMLLGISTDSYDALGLPFQQARMVEPLEPDILESALNKFRGPIDQAYPPYSAVRVQGKPLYWWARQGRLDEIDIPIAQRHIFELSLLSSRLSDFVLLSNFIFERINLVQGNFRQDMIKKSWRELMAQSSNQSLQIVTLRISCSSGTYVRSLVHEIGQHLGVGATTLSIKRTAIGEYQLDNALPLIIPTPHQSPSTMHPINKTT
jgi:tRNA pseudouridine55 synthase